MTSAERKLWARIRDGQLNGAQFRRQHAVGRFIVDVYCAQAKLAIMQNLALVPAFRCRATEGNRTLS